MEKGNYSYKISGWDLTLTQGYYAPIYKYTSILEIQLHLKIQTQKNLEGFKIRVLNTARQLCSLQSKAAVAI
jgi:hypothetical protein